MAIDNNDGVRISIVRRMWSSSSYKLVWSNSSNRASRGWSVGQEPEAKLLITTSVLFKAGLFHETFALTMSTCTRTCIYKGVGSIKLNYLMSGLTPTWYHATNVALHAAACVLVTRVSLTVASLRPGFAALTGLLFAAHPIHTEATMRLLVEDRRVKRDDRTGIGAW
ncbi:hypothetical protein HZH66_008244 [Vespula vulgaris]|uniref:Uncharacterized protein n=1 Tax=Vespula vulgaris TaxID=7454 RepID=A0A834N368_VESVU|nr:hypothetical protein HZH66_008244 [Vespula vulgaris]